jgi:hypothetical protein
MLSFLTTLMFMVCIGAGATMTAAVTQACTPQARREAALLGLDVLRCVLANQGEDDEKVYAACARENVTREDIDTMLKEARSAAAKAGCSSDAGK